MPPAPWAWCRAQLPRSIYDVLTGDVMLADVITLTNRMRLDLVPAAHALACAETEVVEAIPDRYRRSYLLRDALVPTLHRYDYVLIDNPPSLGLLTVNALAAATDGVIVPVQCEYLAMEGLGQLMSTIEAGAPEPQPSSGHCRPGLDHVRCARSPPVYRWPKRCAAISAVWSSRP